MSDFLKAIEDANNQGSPLKAAAPLTEKPAMAQSDFLNAIEEAHTHTVQEMCKLIDSGASYAECMRKRMQGDDELADTVWDVRMDTATGFRKYSDLQKLGSIEGRCVSIVRLQNMSGINTCAGSSMEADYVLRTMLKGYKDMPANVYRTENISEYVVIFDENIKGKAADKYLQKLCKSTEDKAIEYGLENLKYKLTNRPETPKTIAGDVRIADHADTKKFINDLRDANKYISDDKPVDKAEKEKLDIKVATDGIDEYYKKLWDVQSKYTLECDDRLKRNIDIMQTCKNGGAIAVGDFINMTGLNDKITGIIFTENPELFETKDREEPLSARDIAIRNEIADAYIDEGMRIIKECAEQHAGRLYRDKGSDEVYVAVDNEAASVKFAEEASARAGSFYENAGFKYEVYSKKDNAYIPVTVLLAAHKINTDEAKSVSTVFHNAELEANEAKENYKEKNKQPYTGIERRNPERPDRSIYRKVVARILSRNLSR